FGKEGLSSMGNEGNGIRPTSSAAIDTAVTIPRHGRAESLNVGIARALFCSEIARRRKFYSPTMSHQTTPTIHTPRLACLCLSSLLFSASFNMIIPELPNYLSSLGGGEHKGLIIALFTLTAGISRPFSGKLTDQWGRVPVMAVGSIVCVLCGFLYPILSSLAGFFILRLVHGFSTGFKPTATSAYIADIIP